MEQVNQGEACGRCHGTVAFPVATCGRCHVELGVSEGSATAELLGDLTLTRSGESATANGSFPLARFPHWVHRIRYRCDACHPEPFEARAGTTATTMQSMQQGGTCGRCHNNREAFGLFECNRCHVPPEVRSDSVP